jgi:hypothetical protein
MPTLIDLVEALGEVFDKLQLRYAVGGAIANNYWGIVRATKDIDCLIALPAIKYQLFADALNELKCTMRDRNDQHFAITVPRLLEQVQNRKLIECYREQVRIELFVPAVPLQDEILRRAIPVHLGSREIPITSAEDLILLKLVFHRVKDLQDVRGMLWLQRGKLDLNYLRLWSTRTHEPNVQKELERLILEYSDNSASDS